MATVSDLFSRLKSIVVGVKSSQIDAELDKAVRDIVLYKSNSGRNGYIDLVKAVIAKSAVTSNLSGLYTPSGLSGPSIYGQASRLARYKTYSAIVSNIDYASRALSVLVDNILSPDDITKVSLDVKPKQYLEDDETKESQVKYVKEVISKTLLEKHLDLIVRNTLEFGDFFCEITSTKGALLSRSILVEGEQYRNLLDDGSIQEVTESVKIDNKKRTFRFILDYTSHLQESRTSLGNTKLIYHKPNLVVKLQSSLFPMCFGYLVFPDIAGITNPGAPLQDDAVNQICMSILNNLAKQLPQMKEFQNNKDLKDIITALVSNSDPHQALQIRYVPPDKMQHFLVPSLKYFPYGESIFDSSQFSAKVLIALETALAIQRLSRSTEKRKIAIEVGLPRDAKKAIEAMKEEFKKRKISLDSFGSVDTIPSLITTFEDIYIPQKDGKPFVDVSTFTEGNVDVRSKVDELKFLRDSFVASLQVPPSFLGIEENLSNKAALSEENILFARTIIRHQKYFGEQINDLIQKIIGLVDPSKALTYSDNVTVHLPTPKTLQYEREASFLDGIISLIENLERIGIPKEYSKKKYLSNFDWDTINAYSVDQKVEKALEPSKEEEEPFGGEGSAY